MDTSGTTPMADSVWRSQSWLIDVNRQARLNLMVAGGRMLALVGKHQAHEDIVSHKKKSELTGSHITCLDLKKYHFVLDSFNINFLIPAEVELKG